MKLCIVLATLIASAACGRRGERPVPPPNTPGTNRATAADTTPPDAPTISVAPVSPQSALGHLMVGTWDISPTGVGGPHLSITVSSADGAAFQGRLIRALAGNVLLEVERFQPFTGTVEADSAFRMSIGWREKGPPPAELAGKIAGEELRLTRFVWGGEQQALPGRTWTGRRAK